MATEANSSDQRSVVASADGGGQECGRVRTSVETSASEHTDRHTDREKEAECPRHGHRRKRRND
ncbi:hypothetical protein QJS04_geneDACA000783 [Acorus gramineus]|uniref:Uncharacterized protein n=1 Tax=Acorus gramineus TaxID=55184 RepID=A0AAV9BH55_ACOGR|nr:hypothetical protein QJS04_geneDACA000783 [Acorus gramineus]